MVYRPTLCDCRDHPHSNCFICLSLSKPVVRKAQASGVSVDDKCLSAFQELKLKKTYKYIIYSLSQDKTQIVVEKTSKSTDYDDFLNDLPEDDCRWAVYDVQYEKEGGGQRNKITFFAW
jgi:cofilin